MDANELIKKMQEFYRVREWDQFHSPKNLVMDLASEVGELCDIFRWLSEAQSHNPDDKEAVKDEIGDVVMMSLYLAHKLGIDPMQAAAEKLEKVGKKYPVSQCKGRSDKYTAYTTE